MSIRKIGYLHFKDESCRRVRTLPIAYIDVHRDMGRMIWGWLYLAYYQKRALHVARSIDPSVNQRNEFGLLQESNLLSNLEIVEALSGRSNVSYYSKFQRALAILFLDHANISLFWSAENEPDVGPSVSVQLWPDFWADRPCIGDTIKLCTIRALIIW